jgi:hypothetical protein
VAVHATADGDHNIPERHAGRRNKKQRPSADSLGEERTRDGDDKVPDLKDTILQESVRDGIDLTLRLNCLKAKLTMRV